jgi:hypothetical protein
MSAHFSVSPSMGASRLVYRHRHGSVHSSHGNGRDPMPDARLDRGWHRGGPDRHAVVEPRAARPHSFHLCCAPSAGRNRCRDMAPRRCGAPGLHRLGTVLNFRTRSWCANHQRNRASGIRSYRAASWFSSIVICRDRALARSLQPDSQRARAKSTFEASTCFCGPAAFG